MIFDIWIEEWSKKSKKMPHICQLFSENYDKGKAFSLVTKLINREKGVWKNKDLISIDSAYGAVKVSKDDLLFFIDKFKENKFQSEKNKILKLDISKEYALWTCES
tara:strand:+ start:533 stop:850 length:318 start_codon:yes stop_codon:yes gene_type:complete